MPLKNKYLKYNQEITLEMFKEIWTKLINSGWKATCDYVSISNRFYEFKKGEHLYNDNPSRKSFYINYKSIQKYIKDSDHILTETTVQDILGYDPFVKEVIKEIIPEYVECIKKDTQVLPGMIYKIQLEKGFLFDGSDDVYYINNMAYYQSFFKPSTKEAFDAQNKPKQPLKQAVHCKTQEEWDFVCDKNGYSFKSLFKNITAHCIRLDREIDSIGGLQWCKDDNYQILSFQEWRDLNGYKMETNIDLTGRHLKALIDGPQSTTYKKGDIVEIFKKESSNQYRIGRVGGVWWTYTTNNGTESQWELLPEDYKVEKEVKFEVGKWYKNLGVSNRSSNFGKFLSIRNGCEFWMSECIYQESKVDIEEQWLNYSDQTVECSLEEIQQYLPEGHPNKITPGIQQTRDIQKSNQEFKVGDWIVIITDGNTISKKGSITVITYNDGKKIMTPELDKAYPTKSGWLVERNIRHATPVEIKWLLISTGQIPAGEPLNNGIEPNKDGMFKYTTGNSYDKDFSTSIVPGPLKMTLSIDDEELPMVNIIKTKTVNLLNLE